MADRLNFYTLISQGKMDEVKKLTQEVIDVGVDALPEKFVRATKEHGAEIVALSALLATTMLEMKSIIEALKAAGLSNSVKTIIGGAPVTEGFANKIGADGYAPDAV